MLRSITRSSAVPACILAFVIAAAGVLVAPSPAAAAQHEVRIGDSAFAPVNLVVRVGDTVTWVNADDRPHTVSASDGAFDSGNMDEGAAFTFTFTKPGTYPYQCQYHPEMQAAIVVEPAADAPAQHGGEADGAGAGGGESTPSGNQPDTALPAPPTLPGISLLLWGLAFVILAFTFLPSRRPVPSTAERAGGGWRR